MKYEKKNYENRIMKKMKEMVEFKIIDIIFQFESVTFLFFSVPLLNS